jgi:hypothetical protein
MGGQAQERQAVLLQLNDRLMNQNRVDASDMNAFDILTV